MPTDHTLREFILKEIRRLAEANGGKAPGIHAFERETSIGRYQWLGMYWARWGDALAEAGLAPNALQSRLDSGDVLTQVIEACRYYGHLPTTAELRLYGRGRSFVSKNTVAAHFGSKAGMIAALARRVADDPSCSDIAAMLPTETAALPEAPPSPAKGTADGYVYLIKSGDHYKIGRSDELERRVREVRIALPEAMTLVHTIRTDDPPGIEAYWHRRFADRRANGEWFKLTANDLRAFKKRKYQ
jgi:hypothetical protein